MSKNEFGRKSRRCSKERPIAVPRHTTRPYMLPLLASLVVPLGAGGQAAAADAVWNGSGAQPTNYSLSTNWTPSGPPSGTATFGTSSYYGTLAAPITGGTVFPGTWNFSTAPQTYFLQLSGGADAIFGGLGVVGSAANITINEFVEFNGPTTSMGGASYTNNNTLYVAQGSAGSANITNTANGTLIFVNNPASAGTATIANGGITEFGFGSSASSASINNTNQLYFFGNSTAGSSSITTGNGGRTYFLYNPGDPAGQTPSGGTASQTVNAGGILDISALSDGSTCNTNGSACTTGAPPYGNAVTFTAGSIAGAGDIYLGANTLSVGSLNTSTQFSGVIHDGASPTATADLGEAPAGSGSLSKVGTGTLTLSGNNTYTGGTSISGGVLQLGNGAASGSILGNVADGGTLAFDRSDTHVFAGNITDNGGTAGAVSQIGSGTTVLTGTNSYTGGTTISAGTLQLGNGGTTGSIAGNVTNNAALAFNRSDAVTFGGVISGTGVVSQIGSGTTILTGANTYTGGSTISAGTLQLGNGGTTGSIVGNVTDNGALAFNRSDVVTFGGVVSGSGAVNQIGSGTTVLTSANTYTGGTTISAGTLQLGNGGTTGSIVGNVTDNGALAFNRSNAVTFGGVVSGTGMVNQIGSGTTILTGTNTYTGGTTISAGTLQIGNGGTSGSITGNVVDNAALAFNRADAVTLGGVVSGAGAVNQIGSGTTVLTAVNTYTGGTTISAGTLQLGNGGTIGSIVGAVIDNGVLAFDRSNAYSFGAISGTGAVKQIGTGTTTLTGANSYTGLTTVSSGTLVLATAASVVGGVSNNAIFTTTGSVSGGLANTGTVNANGGAVNGAITNNAGTFNVGGTVSSNNTFNNASGATLALGGAANYTVQGLLTNSGAVTVAAGGRLDASAGGITNNVNGSITVAAGGTVVDTLNNSGPVSNAGAYAADVNNSSTGTITNQSGGVWTGNLLSNTGLVNNQTGATWIGNATNNIGGTLDNSGTWTGSIANAGTFTNSAGASVSGLLTNTAGVTTNLGALNGGADITGGTLTGTGSVAGLTVSGGATFAPGNGTPGSSMTVGGNLAFLSGALYVIQINPATASFANVGGTASLGNATVNATFATGSYVSKQYTIVNATGGIVGTFGALNTTNLPGNFTTSLSYDTSHAYLNLTLNFTPNPPPNPGPAFPSGLNVNQTAVANALIGYFNSKGSIPLVFGALTSSGLTRASGETATGSQQTTIDAMDLFLGLLTDPFVAGRGEVAPGSSPVAAYSQEYAGAAQRPKNESDAYAAVYGKAPPWVDTFAQRWSVWGAGFGGSQTTDGNTVLGSNGSTSRIYGAAAGADYRISPFTLAGFAMAGGGTNFSIANGLGAGRSDLFQAGAFVRHAVGPAYISAAIAYGWQDITNDRTVGIAGVDRLRAEFNANTLSGRIEGGYRWVTPWMGVTPYAAGRITTFELPSYAEQVLSGGNTFALGYAGKSVTASRSEAGIRTDKSWAMPDSVVTVRSRIAWAHDFNTDRSIGATFLTLPGASFVVNGAAQARDAALATASAEIKWLNGLSLAATFESELSNITRSYAGKGVVRYAW